MSDPTQELDYSHAERQRNVSDDHYERFFLLNPGADIVFTIGAEDTNVIPASIQVADVGGEAIEEKFVLDVFVCSDADGEVPAAPSGGIAIAGGVGAIIEAVVANEHIVVATDATGKADFELTEVGDNSFYLGVRLPTGRYVVSGEMDFET